MRNLVVRSTQLASVVLALVGGVALADGGAYASGAQASVTQANFVCRGGVRVQIALSSNTARVDFAGRTQTLRLTPDNSGGRYQNAQLAWFTKGSNSYMQERATGRLALSDCKQTQ